VLERAINGLRALVDRSRTEVRLTAGVAVRRERIPLAQFIEEIQVAGALEANARGVELTVEVADGGLAVEADRQILASAVSNLLSNAVKFTRAKGHVTLKAHGTANRLLIEVSDECGGLSTEKIEDLFRPLEQQGSDRSGLGLGLAMSSRRRSERWRAARTQHRRQGMHLHGRPSHASPARLNAG
jgi:signal transduction histidine kinase